MRNFIQISEQFLTSFSPSYARGKVCEIFKNPSKKEYKELTKSSNYEYGEVRAFLVGSDIIMWNVYSSLHQSVREELNLPDTAIPVTIAGDMGSEVIVMITDNTRNTPLWHSPDVGYAVKSHPYIRRNFSEVEIDYYDNAIVGPWEEIEDNENEAELNESVLENTSPIFQLAPGFDPKNYIMTDSLHDFESWKAMTYAANNGGKIGTMAKIGYVWISLKDNTIIPISRNDEHNMGGDMLYSYVSKNKLSLNLRDYLPIYGHGTNYIYNEDEIKPMVVALSKFLSYGGHDGILKGSSSQNHINVTSKQFVALKGHIDIKPGELAPMGAALISEYRKLADALANARNTDVRSIIGKAFVDAANLLKFISKASWGLPDPYWNDVEKNLKQLKELRKDGDIQGLSELFFGFHSIKNKIHMGLKKYAAELANNKEDYFYKTKGKSFWGDIDLAIDMLSRF